MISYKQITTTSFVLTAEGCMIVENGSHEYRVWEVLPAQGGVAMSIPDLKVRIGSCRQARLGLSGEPCHQDAGMKQRD
jgi:hypothetical protein